MACNETNFPARGANLFPDITSDMNSATISSVIKERNYIYCQKPPTSGK